MTLEIDRPVAAPPDETDAFRYWWSQTHDWDHTDTGVYEQRFKAAFVAGWRAARESKTDG